MIIIVMGYQKGDRVIVYLSTKDRENENAVYKICRVEAVGQFDLLCETCGTFNKLFRVSKKRCVKIPNKKFNPEEDHPRKPRVGDLILSMRDSYREDRDEFTGIVENITYDPTLHPQPVYVVRIGQQTVRAYLENIIILESAK